MGQGDIMHLSNVIILLMVMVGCFYYESKISAYTNKKKDHLLMISSFFSVDAAKRNRVVTEMKPLRIPSSLIGKSVLLRMLNVVQSPNYKRFLNLTK